MPAGITFRDFVDCDNDVEIEGVEDQDVTSTSVDSCTIESDNENDNVNESETVKPLSLKMAYELCVQLTNFALENNNNELLDIMTKAKDIVQKETIVKSKQSDIKSYFMH